MRDNVKWPKSTYLSAVMPTDTLGGGEVAYFKDSDPTMVNAVPRLSPLAKVVTCCCGQELCLEMDMCSNQGEA